MQCKAKVSFFAKHAGNTQINVFGVDGKNLTGLNSNFQEGINTFQLSLAPGAYILKVNGNGYTYTQRVISQSNSTEKPTLSFIGNQKPTNSQPQKTKNGGAVISMLYTVGDQILYKGISGNYTTIVTDKPTESKSTNFYFVECKDADDNYYPVVIIGSQIWMAENLNTTIFRTGESISKVTNNNTWSTAIFSMWCDYNNDVSNSIKYGKLYNWFAVSDSRNIAPLKWHIPTDS
ncbi:MAG: FISUMP domain-containing protein, partial [Verrucomicrobiota bacterium]